MTVHRLTAPPRLSSALVRAALAARSKRGPYEQARLPAVRLMLPEARIDAGRLAAYNRVCGFDGSEAQPPADASAPEQAPAPPSYPHVMAFPLAMELMARADFPFPVLGLVHTGVELTQYRALRPGDRPEISVYANGLAPHRRGTAFDVVTEFRLQGRLVWHSRSSYLCRHRTPDSQDGAATKAASGHGDQADGREAAQQNGAGAQQQAPLPLRGHWDLPSSLGRRYGRASGDRNPIHLHPLTARLFGFPRHIAHGMWTFARAVAGTGAAAGAEQLTARAEFKAPVLLPSRVAYHVDEPTASAGSYRAPVRVHRFELRSGGENGQRERLHLTGEVTSEHP